MSAAAKTLALDSVDEVLVRLGSAEMSARDVVRAIYPDLAERDGDEIAADRALIGLAPDQPHQRAYCCQPVPGERIVGITFRGQGVIVHAIDCEALADYEDQPERWIDLHWQEGTHSATNTVSIDISISNETGVLGRICSLIAEQDANISDLKFEDRKPDYYRLLIDVDLRDAEHLHRVVTALEAENTVSSVERRRDPGQASVRR